MSGTLASEQFWIIYIVNDHLMFLISSSHNETHHFDVDIHHILAD